MPWTRTKTSSHSTKTKKSSNDTQKTPSKTTNTQSETTNTEKHSKDTTNTNKAFPVKLPTRADLDFITQLVLLCNATLFNIGAYVSIQKLATYDPRDLDAPRQFNRIVRVLEDIVEIMGDTVLKMRATTLYGECNQIGACRGLLAAAHRIPPLVRYMKAHATAAEAAEASKGKRLQPGQVDDERVEAGFVELSTLKSGPDAGNFSDDLWEAILCKNGLVEEDFEPWDECEAAVESAFQFLR